MQADARGYSNPRPPEHPEQRSMDGWVVGRPLNDGGKSNCPL